MFQLTTQRLILREPIEGDAEALHAAVFGDPVAMRYIGDGSPRTIEQVRTSQGRKIDCFQKHGVTLWTVILRETGEIVGDCGVIPIAWQGPAFELAYRFGPRAWGRGLATEAGRAALTHAWEVTDLAEVVGVTDLGNAASQRVLAKLGFEDLGTTTDYYGGEELRSFRIARPQ